MPFLEKIKFYYRMILLNRKNTIIMLLGLSISLAIISEGLIFIYTFQYDAFSSFNQQVPTRQFTVTVGAFDVTGFEDEVIPIFNNVTRDIISEIGLTEKVLRADWISERGAMIYVNSSGEGKLLPNFNLYGLPPDYFSAFEDILYNGTLPYQGNDVLVIASKSIIESTNLSNLGMFPLYVPVFDLSGDIYTSVEMGIPAAGNYVNVTGLVLKEDFESYLGLMEEDFRALDDYLTDQFMISTYKGVTNFAQSIDYFTGQLGFTCRFSFDLKKVDAFNIAKEISDLNRLGQEFVRVFAESHFDIVIYPDLIDQLKAFNSEFIIFQLINLLFITPIIGMALSLTNYSTNLLRQRQKKQVSNMLQRGASRKEVVSFLIFQVVEFTIVAILVCFIIGFPFASLMLKSNNFLNFSGISRFPALNMVIFYSIISLGFIFSLIINVKNIWDTSNISIEEAYGTTFHRKPFWEKTYLDIILIALGIVLWLIVAYQFKGTAAYSFAYGIGTSAPVCLILGSILFTTRIYPYVLDVLAKIGWNSSKIGILGLSAKRTLRRKSSTIRSLILISLTFTIIISSLTTTNSYKYYDIEHAYYKLGADILIRNVDFETHTMKNKVLEVEGIEQVTYLTMTSQIITYGSLLYSYFVVGINPEEYAKVAYIEKQYIGTNDKSTFFGLLKNKTDIFMQKNQLDIVGLKVGEQFKLAADKYALGRVNYTLNIVGSYNYLPRFFMSYPIPDQSVFRFTMMGAYNLTKELAYNKHNIVGDLLVKVAEGYKIHDVADAIENKLNRRVDDVESLMGTFEGSLRNTMLYGSLNTAFLSSLIITIFAISLMIVIQSIEYEMEVTMLKTLGMSPKQLFNLFTIESLSLVVFGSIIGLGVGIFTAKMFMEILTIDNILPPISLVFQIGQIILAFGLLFITAIGAAALTSWIIFRKDTIQGIKQT